MRIKRHLFQKVYITDANGYFCKHKLKRFLYWDSKKRAITLPEWDGIHASIVEKNKSEKIKLKKQTNDYDKIEIV